MLCFLEILNSKSEEKRSFQLISTELVSLWKLLKFAEVFLLVLQQNVLLLLLVTTKVLRTFYH